MQPINNQIFSYYLVVKMANYCFYFAVLFAVYNL